MIVDEKAGRLKALIAKIRTADTAYYRDDTPIMTDREYNKLVDELQELEAETGLILSGSPHPDCAGGYPGRTHPGAPYPPHAFGG